MSASGKGAEIAQPYRGGRGRALVWTAHESLSPLKSGSGNRADGGREGGRASAAFTIARQMTQTRHEEQPWN